eukprot:gnl/TRDRNA2_/TRDRNA2_196152_c0_seq1.p1 gnl/TRDRNA2_/TRDRNA2_196152_c0~~gnl/TRDRNA2_/TRDRNA2_196152_c0_seq1.p1  ORF type:complete len:352 (-),score=60.07 gnl/TRDRNA2_/TRDRNA2_196152_c0_seq1:118-1173(-)
MPNPSPTLDEGLLEDEGLLAETARSHFIYRGKNLKLRYVLVSLCTAMLLVSVLWTRCSHQQRFGFPHRESASPDNQKLSFLARQHDGAESFPVMLMGEEQSGRADGFAAMLNGAANQQSREDLMASAQELMKDPDMMQKVLNDPLVKSMVSDPSMLAQAANTPLIKEMLGNTNLVQSAMRNPALKALVDDPAAAEAAKEWNNSELVETVKSALAGSTTPAPSLPNAPSELLPNAPSRLTPDFMADAQKILSDPTLLQQAMNDPKVKSIMSDPKMMQEAMNHPVVAQMMKNPHLISDAMTNPEMKSVLNDPDWQAKAKQMALDPTLAQKMMKSFGDSAPGLNGGVIGAPKLD